MPVTVKQRRTKVTKKDIEAARRELLKQPKQLIKSKIERETLRYKKDFWYGSVYCDSNGWASIVGDNLEGIWLGKTDEVIPYLKSRRIDGENVGMVLQAIKEFRTEKETPSCHLATKVGKDHIVIPPTKPHRATFKEDPRFLRLLDSLIAEGCGLPTIQKRLKENGYDAPYRTLGRWVKKHRDTICS